MRSSFLPKFLDALALNYGAGLRVLDFAGAPEESRRIINDWVDQQTEERIKDLIPEGGIDSSTVMVLSNAVYFKATWLLQFDERSTQNGLFYLADGGTVTVPMMRQTESFGYTKGDGYRAVELLYEGRQVSMVILLPDSGNLGAIEKALDPQFLSGVIDALEEREVRLMMPRFEFEAEKQLSETLSEMGMPEAFSGSDFARMRAGGGLWIDEVYHKAFVAVDEVGTEAAAATAVVMTESAPAEPVSMIIDHPFIFFIRDIDTGTVLFVGRVMDPTG